MQCISKGEVALFEIKHQKKQNQKKQHVHIADKIKKRKCVFHSFWKSSLVYIVELILFGIFAKKDVFAKIRIVQHDKTEVIWCSCRVVFELFELFFRYIFCNLFQFEIVPFSIYVIVQEK